jgi:hypothetical protein
VSSLLSPVCARKLRSPARVLLLLPVPIPSDHSIA